MDIWGASAQNTNQLLQAMSSSIKQGLTPSQVSSARVKYGRNVSADESKPIWLAVLKRQVASPFIYLLLAAALASFLLHQRTETAFILLFVVLNTALGFFQEYRSEQTAQLLKKYVATKATLRRERSESVVDQAELVPGDIILLKPGDVIPADVRFVESQELEVDESVLSGESVAVEKMSKALDTPAKRVFEAKNLGFAGTVVTRGKGIALVVTTGHDLVANKIGTLVAQTEHVSGFQKGLAQFSRFILQLMLVTLVLVVGANIILKGDAISIPELLVFAIALAVSVVPEALPVVMTFSLSQGARRLSQKHVIVKRLSAIEDLGAMEVLCADKTGTLTENIMTVGDVYSLDGVDPLVAAAWAIDPHQPQANAQRNSFDTAIVASLGKHKKLGLSVQRLAEIPFDPQRRFETIVVRQGQSVQVVLRGAHENVLKHCQKVTPQQMTALQQWVERTGQQGRRVLAVAGKRTTSTGPALLKNAERGVTLYGLISFIDPIKPSTPAAIKRAQELGVAVKILTGDRPEVAGAVATQIGLISSPDQVMTGEQLFALSEAQRHRAVEDYRVFARVTPEQKYRIIHLLQHTHQVGFMGEGINDAPALKIADVAIVVDDASDVARSAADIILLRKSLHVVVEGIAEGRRVFANTLKYIRATLSSNLGNFCTIALASLFIDALPLLPVQILLINLLTDFPMIFIGTDRVDDSELASPKGYQMKDIALLAMLLGFVSVFADFVIFGVFRQAAPGVLQTNWFMESVLTELVFLFSVRTRGPFFRSKPASLLVALSLLAFLLTISLPYLAIGHSVFSFVSPAPGHLGVILAIVASYFVASEIIKLLYLRVHVPKAGKVH